MFCGPSSPKNISAGELGHLAGHRTLAFLEVTSRATARLISSSLRSSVEASVFFAYEIEEAPEALVLHGC